MSLVYHTGLQAEGVGRVICESNVKTITGRGGGGGNRIVSPQP